MAKGTIAIAQTSIDNYLSSNDMVDMRKAQDVLSRLNDEIALQTDWRPRSKSRQSLDRALVESVANWRFNWGDVRIVYDQRPNKSLSLEIDWIAFHQVLSQLMFNAVAALPERPPDGKHHRGTITLAVAVADNIILTIDDDGKGIPKDLVSGLGQVVILQQGGSGTYAAATYFREAMGGLVRWENRDPGARVTITIPRSVAFEAKPHGDV